jgi:hypothetical protein
MLRDCIPVDREYQTMPKITLNVPAGISFDAAGVGGAFRSIAGALSDLADTQRRVAETSDPGAKLALQISNFEQLQKVSGLTDAAVRAIDVLRLVKSILDQADISSERIIQ